MGLIGKWYNPPWYSIGYTSNFFARFLLYQWPAYTYRSQSLLSIRNSQKWGYIYLDTVLRFYNQICHWSSLLWCKSSSCFNVHPAMCTWVPTFLLRFRRQPGPIQSVHFAPPPQKKRIYPSYILQYVEIYSNARFSPKILLTHLLSIFSFLFLPFFRISLLLRPFFHIGWYLPPGWYSQTKIKIRMTNVKITSMAAIRFGLKTELRWTLPDKRSRFLGLLRRKKHDTLPY